jgi:putative transposase
MRKAFLYRLYPNRPQSDKLTGLLDTARHLYNAALQERRDAYRMQGKSLNYYDQAGELKELRHELPEVAQLNFSATQDMLRRLDKSFKAFFRRVRAGEKPGYPRFRGHDRFNSITFPTYGDGIKIKDNRVYIQNVGLVKIKMHRSLEGKINTVTIKRECDKWYVVFSNSVNIEPLPAYDKQVGIDVGLESFAVTSDGEFIENPRFLREAEAIIRRSQRKVSRRKKGSNSRRKAVKLLAKCHLKISNQRKDFAHKLSRHIVNTYGFIAVEDLQIKNMVQNHHLAKSIADAAWGEFFSFTSYKAEWAGRQFTKVIPNGTSQDCAFCGTVVPKSLSVRIHNCPNCGHSVPRDFNSSLNILERGRRSWSLTWNNGSSVLPEAVCFS